MRDRSVMFALVIAVALVGALPAAVRADHRYEYRTVAEAYAFDPAAYCCSAWYSGHYGVYFNKWVEFETGADDVAVTVRVEDDNALGRPVVAVVWQRGRGQTFICGASPAEIPILGGAPVLVHAITDVTHAREVCGDVAAIPRNGEVTATFRYLVRDHD